MSQIAWDGLIPEVDCDNFDYLALVIFCASHFCHHMYKIKSHDAFEYDLSDHNLFPLCC